jgi:phage terminase large subunit-like protein
LPGDVRSQLPHLHRACVCGNVIPVTEQASGSAKIDRLMAAFKAIALMATSPWSGSRA